MIGDRKIILIISNDEDDRLLGQQSYLLGKRVLTSTCENGWNAGLENSSRLFAVLMEIDDYQEGLAITLLAVKAGAYYIGFISETIPEVLDETFLSINCSLVRLDTGEEFFLSDGRRRNWALRLRSLSTEGPMTITTVPVA